MKITDDEAHYLSTIVRSQVMTIGARHRLLEVIENARVFAGSPKLQLAVAVERAMADMHEVGKITGDDEGCAELAYRVRRHLGGEPVTVERNPRGYGWLAKAFADADGKGGVELELR